MGASRVRLRVVTVLTAVSALALVASILWPQWIETIFGIEPDGGSGAAEFAISAVLVATTVLFFLLTRLERRRLLTLST